MTERIEQKKVETSIDMIESARESFSNFRDKEFRPYQREAIEFVMNSKKKVTVIEVPPGSGKSLSGMVIGKMWGDMIYLCSSIQLQHQLQRDFPEAEMLKGRSNYPCLRLSVKGMSAADCNHSKSNPCIFKSSACPYHKQKEIVLAHPLRILNYYYWLNECFHVGRFKDTENKRIIIADEADTFEDILLDFVSLTFSSYILSRYNIPIPERLTATDGRVSYWVDWAKIVHEKMDDYSAELALKIEVLEDNEEIESPEAVDILKEYKQVRSLSTQLVMFLNCVDDTWIFDRQKRKHGEYWTFKPTWISSKISESFFLNNGSKFVLMSAHLPPLRVLSQMLGIKLVDTDYFSAPSLFNPARRRIFLRPVANLTNKTWNTSLPSILEYIEMLAEHYAGYKGLFHTVSYKLRDAIMSLNNPRFMTHESAKDRVEMLKKFEQSPDPLIMVSPSMERGISLEHEKCRWIVWPKAPWLNKGDKQVKARLFTGGRNGIGQEWYNAMMAANVVQGCGRGTRFDTDWCDSWLLDQQIYNLITGKYSCEYFPPWFRDALVYPPVENK